MNVPLTEQDFDLPFGYVDAEKKAHRQGTLRLPTQKDVIAVFKLAGEVDNPGYLEALLLARMLMKLGDLDLREFQRRVEIVEALVQPDVEYLNAVYQGLVDATPACPMCGCARGMQS